MSKSTWIMFLVLSLGIGAAAKPPLLFTPAGKEKISPETAQEFQLKAIWLQSIVKFIDWPWGSEIYDASKPFIIGILGYTPMKEKIYEIYTRGKQPILDKKVELREISNPNQVLSCHLLFISPSTKYRLSKIISLIQNQPILTVSDTEGFADRGVHINFVIRQRKLCFEVNQREMKNAALSASHHLMKWALRVIMIPDEENPQENKK